MAKEKFARFDDNNVVQDIILIDSNDYIGNTEEDGAQRCAQLTGFPAANFKKCNHGQQKILNRVVSPAVGITLWDSNLNLFKDPPSPYPSWTLNTTTGKYDPPVAKVEKADDGVDINYAIPQYWDENSQTWKIDDYTPVGNIIEI